MSLPTEKEGRLLYGTGGEESEKSVREGEGGGEEDEAKVKNLRGTFWIPEEKVASTAKFSGRCNFIPGDNEVVRAVLFNISVSAASTSYRRVLSLDIGKHSRPSKPRLGAGEWRRRHSYSCNISRGCLGTCRAKL